MSHLSAEYPCAKDCPSDISWNPSLPAISLRSLTLAPAHVYEPKAKSSVPDKSCTYSIHEIVDRREDVVVVCRGSRRYRVVSEDIPVGVGHVFCHKIMKGIFHSPLRQFGCESLCRLFRVAVHGSVDYAYSPFRLISAEHVVSGRDIRDMHFPNGTVRTAYPFDFQTGKFFESSLDCLTVFSHDVGIVSCHFIAECGEAVLRLAEPSAQSGTRILYFPVHCSECAEGIT